MATPRLLTYAEVAGALGVHVNTVRRMVERGDLPRVVIGRSCVSAPKTARRSWSVDWTGHAVMRLVLCELHSDHNEFTAETEGWTRIVTVLVAGDRVIFPHIVWDTGESLGDAHLDERVRRRARGLLALRRGLRREYTM